MEVLQQPTDPEQTWKEAQPSILHTLRRKELERALVYCGHTVKPGATQEVMLRQAQDITERGEVLKMPPEGWKLPDQKPAFVVTEEMKVTPSVPFEPQEYEDMKLMQLRKLVKSRGMKQAITDKKPDLIEKLHGQDTSERS